MSTSVLFTPAILTPHEAPISELRLRDTPSVRPAVVPAAFARVYTYLTAIGLASLGENARVILEGVIYVSAEEGLSPSERSKGLNTGLHLSQSAGRQSGIVERYSGDPELLAPFVAWRNFLLAEAAPLWATGDEEGVSVDELDLLSGTRARRFEALRGASPHFLPPQDPAFRRAGTNAWRAVKYRGALLLHVPRPDALSDVGEDHWPPRATLHVGTPAPALRVLRGG